MRPTHSGFVTERPRTSHQGWPEILAGCADTSKAERRHATR
jgi:hypothetical protein